MSTKADSATKFQFLQAYLIVKRIRPIPSYLITQNTIPAKGSLARNNLKRVELKTFNFSAGPKSMSIVNAVLGKLPKRLHFTMIKDKNSEINPTRRNNCFYSSQLLYSTCFGRQFHPSSGVHILYMASGRQVYLCCNFVCIMVVLLL